MPKINVLENVTICYLFVTSCSKNACSLALVVIRIRFRFFVFDTQKWEKKTSYNKMKSIMWSLLTGWYIHATSIISNDYIRWIGAIKAFVR